jgi:hypothetical protein
LLNIITIKLYKYADTHLKKIFIFLIQEVKKAKEYFKRKIDYITKQIEKVQPLLHEKYRMKQGKMCKQYTML